MALREVPLSDNLPLAGRRVHLFTAPVRPLVRLHGLSGLGAASAGVTSVIWSEEVCEQFAIAA